MGTRMNRQAYERLIKEDLEALSALPDTLERDHISQVLAWSILANFGRPGAEPLGLKCHVCGGATNNRFCLYGYGTEIDKPFIIHEHCIAQVDRSMGGKVIKVVAVEE